jgi:hypothetical protein
MIVSVISLLLLKIKLDVRKIDIYKAHDIARQLLNLLDLSQRNCMRRYVEDYLRFEKHSIWLGS